MLKKKMFSEGKRFMPFTSFVRGGYRAGYSATSTAVSTVSNVGSNVRRNISKLSPSKLSPNFRKTTTLRNNADEVIENADEVIEKTSKTRLRKMGKMCADNAVMCSAGVALAGYTAVNMVDNSKEQQKCIAKCLPPNWPQVVSSDGDVEPQYFEDALKPSSPDDPDEHSQPQCTEGKDCESFCIDACKAEHPTTLIGSALEGAGELVDDVVVPFVEDVIGIPITDIGSKLLWVIRIVAILIVSGVVVKMYRMTKRRPVLRIANNPKNNGAIVY